MRHIAIATVLAVIAMTAQAKDTHVSAHTTRTMFSSASSTVPALQAKGRAGSRRSGGHSSHGKGSHYVGGRK